MPTPIPIVGPCYETVLQENAQQLINWYVEFDMSAGRNSDESGRALYLKPTEGLTLFSTISGSSVRGLFTVNSVVYAVVDNTLYTVSSAGTATSQGTLSTSSGTVKMCASDSQLLIIDGTYGYVYNIDGDTFATISDSDFPTSPVDCTYQDGYFFVTQSTDQKVYYSAISEATSWNALDFLALNNDADLMVGLISDHQEVWAFSENGAKPLYNTGDSTAPWQQRPGVIIHKGLAARDSLVQMDNTVYWLSKDKSGSPLVLMMSGYTPQNITSHAVAQAFAGYTTVSDAKAFSYRQGLHEFYVITFPTHNVTWVYDVTTQLWHQRQSLDGTTYGRYRPNNHTYCYSKNLVGDFNSGKIYYIDRTCYTENTTTIRRVRRTQHLDKSQYLSSIYNFQVDVEPGVGLTTGQGSDPQIMLRVSKDGGHTWGNEMWRSIGATGVYNRRVKWDSLGVARIWTFELTYSDPTDCTILGAYCDIEIGTA